MRTHAPGGRRWLDGTPYDWHQFRAINPEGGISGYDTAQPGYPACLGWSMDGKRRMGHAHQKAACMHMPDPCVRVCRLHGRRLAHYICTCLPACRLPIHGRPALQRQLGIHMQGAIQAPSRGPRPHDRSR